MSYTITTGSTVEHAGHTWEGWSAYLEPEYLETGILPDGVTADDTGICCHTCETIVVDRADETPAAVVDQTDETPAAAVETCSFHHCGAPCRFVQATGEATGVGRWTHVDAALDYSPVTGRGHAARII